MKHTNGKRPATYTSLPGSETTFTEVLSAGASFKYLIRAVYEDGGESPISGFPEVKTP